jgi:hypothetical protein
MATSQQSDDGVLPFDKSDVRGGIGKIEKIVALSEHPDSDGVVDGRCNWCGYDRGTLLRHTEVEGEQIQCRNCDCFLKKE